LRAIDQRFQEALVIKGGGIGQPSDPPGGSSKFPPLELYNFEINPFEQHNLAPDQPAIVACMHADYLAWFKDVAATRGFEPARIEIGGERENPTILTRQDWRGPRAGWGPNDLGSWEVEVAREGRFDLTAHLTPRRFPTVAHVKLRGASREIKLGPDAAECTFADLPLTAGPAQLEAWAEVPPELDEELLELLDQAAMQVGLGVGRGQVEELDQIGVFKDRGGVGMQFCQRC